jgi:16S rRNA (cytidine1402-2'-O)-methyltransferase
VGGKAVSGVLYVVATPIGNLDDITGRALKILAAVDLIAAEDTRRTRRLLTHYGIARPVTSYYDAVERQRAPLLVARLHAGGTIALVSDAGTPGIADPGYHLVRAALAAGVQVVPIPGPSAVAAVVSVAGLAAERFVFEGFLPTKAGARADRLAALAREPRAVVFYEAARRLPAFLAAAQAALGDRDVVIARELTKLHEEFLRGRLSTIAAGLAERADLKGEVTVLVAGATGASAVVATSIDIDAEIRRARAAGQGLREVAATLARVTGRPRREIYQRALALEQGRCRRPRGAC